jgi:hypothetical protein
MERQARQEARRANQSPGTRAAAQALRLQNQMEAARHQEQAEIAEEASWAARLSAPPMKNAEQAVIPPGKIMNYMLKEGANHAQQFSDMGFMLSKKDNTPEEEAEVRKQAEQIESQIRANLSIVPCYPRPEPQGDSLKETAERQREAKQKEIDFGPVVNTPMMIKGPKATRPCVLGWLFKRSPAYTGEEQSFATLATIYPEIRLDKKLGGAHG